MVYGFTIFNPSPMSKIFNFKNTTMINFTIYAASSYIPNEDNDGYGRGSIGLIIYNNVKKCYSSHKKYGIFLNVTQAELTLISFLIGTTLCSQATTIQFVTKDSVSLDSKETDDSLKPWIKCLQTHSDLRNLDCLSRAYNSDEDFHYVEALKYSIAALSSTLVLYNKTYQSPSDLYARYIPDDEFGPHYNWEISATQSGLDLTLLSSVHPRNSIVKKPKKIMNAWKAVLSFVIPNKTVA